MAIAGKAATRKMQIKLKTEVKAIVF